jgi:hypothetical protein
VLPNSDYSLGFSLIWNLARFGVAALALVFGFVGLQGSFGWGTPLRKSGR